MKKNKKGFTLAELLIVVAIIGVLVAISIPIFSNQLRKARLATNQANARAAYAAWVAQYIDEGMPYFTGDGAQYLYDTTTGKISGYHWYARNYGQRIYDPKTNEPITDISSWKTTTKVGPDYTLGSNVYKYWQIKVRGQELAMYYAYIKPDGHF